MLGIPRFLRKPLIAVAALLSLLALAACEPGTTVGGGPMIDPTKPVPVALLVPSGSGQAGDELLARSLENAARLAIADLDGVRIDLRVYPTAGSPANAAAAAVRAVDEGAKIILGPLYGPEAVAVGQAVAGRGINVLSFSNNADVAGRNVFVLGPTFRNTASRLIRYAVARGKGRVFVVEDQTPAGEVGLKAIQGAVAGSGATLAGIGAYAFSQQGVIDAASGIAQQIRDTSADAVFFTADTSGALPLITQLLAENGAGPSVLQYLGLTRWDIPSATLSLPGVQGGWFALPDPTLSAQFASRFSAAYGEPPHPVASLAYDGIAAIGALVKAGNPNALTAGALTQSAGFAGVGGIFRLLPDGTNERGLAVAQILNNQVTVIDPAPRSFGGAGS